MSSDSDSSKRSTWGEVLAEWTAITFGVLLGGGVAMHALEALRHPGSADFGSWTNFRWTLGFLVLAMVLFAVFVWPTRYAYYWTAKKDALVRVERLTGKTDPVPL